MERSAEVVIIGAGLSGLLLASLLNAQGRSVIVLEASDRIGGRIETVTGATGLQMELGATWFSDMHPNLTRLAVELGLGKFPQYARGRSLFQTKSFEPAQEFEVPENESPSFRFVGGTALLITTLANRLSPEVIRLQQRVTRISLSEAGVTVDVETGQAFVADRVVSCIPPQLFGAAIETSPGLPPAIAGLLPQVQTWMAGAIKFVLEYERGFWWEKGFSGMLYSHAGIITEMYDHSNVEADRFGFTGFLNGGASRYAQNVRKEFVLRQLGDLLGEEVMTPISYADKVWADQYLISGQPAFTRPHENNGHPALQNAYLNDRLYFCGTETATECGGYMEGAVVAAKALADRLGSLPAAGLRVG